MGDAANAAAVAAQAQEQQRRREEEAAAKKKAAQGEGDTKQSAQKTKALQDKANEEALALWKKTHGRNLEPITSLRGKMTEEEQMKSEALSPEKLQDLKGSFARLKWTNSWVDVARAWVALMELKVDDLKSRGIKPSATRMLSGVVAEQLLGEKEGSPTELMFRTLFSLGNPLYYLPSKERLPKEFRQGVQDKYDKCVLKVLGASDALKHAIDPATLPEFGTREPITFEVKGNPKKVEFAALKPEDGDTAEQLDEKKYLRAAFNLHLTEEFKEELFHIDENGDLEKVKVLHGEPVLQDGKIQFEALEGVAVTKFASPPGAVQGKFVDRMQAVCDAVVPKPEAPSSNPTP